MSLLNFLGGEVSFSSRSGLPLYAYDYDPAPISQLTDELRLRLRRRAQDVATAEAFVFWAAERIRSAYQGGPLTWKLVFDGLGLPEDRDLACNLVVTGLGRFKRRVRRSDNGRTLYLFTLLAEGGVPDPMLRQGNGVYRRVVLGLLNEIEREGGVGLDPRIAEQIAARRAAYLPDVFHNSEAARTLAELALALAALRQALPDGLPGAAAVAWFDANRSGWRQGLPLRVSAAALEALIIPALEMVRTARPGGEPVASRELRLGVDGEWVSFLRVSHTGWLDGAALPNARNLSLRLIGSGLPSEAATVFYGAWEASGWTLSRPGSDRVIPLALDAPFSLKAYADGVAVGKSIVEPGLPLAREAPTFWRPVDGQTAETCDRLAPQLGRPRTSAPGLWLLAASDARVDADAGLTIGECRAGPEGKVWPLCGTGRLRVGDEGFEVTTGADVSEKAYAMEAIGPAFAGWQLPSGGSIFSGRPTMRGVFPGAGDSRVLRDDELKRDAAAGLGAEFVAWVERGETLARIKTIRLPREAGIEARETGRGALELSIRGLEHGWRLTLQVGKEVAHATSSAGVAEIEMPAPKAPQAMISLRLSEPKSGKTLDLVAPWPARQGMLLSPKGERLQRDEPVCVEELIGWRAVAPAASAKLLLRAHGGGEVVIAGGDEYPLTLLAPQIRSMLALGGPDAQVNLSLIVNGSESRRLQVRRYHDTTQLEGGDWLHVALSRDGRDSLSRGHGKLFDGQIDVHINAIEIENGLGREKEIVARNLNLRELLGDDGGLWIILARVRGRVQRPVAWSPRPMPWSRRADRIAGYAEQWKRLTRETDATAWKEQWSTIEKVQCHGDVGCLDRVQALASTPRALIKQAYLVGLERLADHLTLDHAAPFLWPAIPLGEFVEGLRGVVEHMAALLATFVDEPRIRELVSGQIILRSKAIAALRPELAAHIGHALNVLKLLDHLPPGEFLAELSRFATPRPLNALQGLAQSAAQKHFETPVGIAELHPRNRPPRMDFDADRQRLVDAPLVVAEAATERRPILSESEMLALVLLRMCDAEFFDRAAAAAIQLAIEEGR